MRHKRILDEAAEHPEASLDAIADTIPSATPDLVEWVLDRYGDPADDLHDPNEPTDEPGEPPMVDDRATPDPNELTEKQIEILRAIADSPDATQRELAASLDVSAPTVSNRVNSIDGFDWEERQAFVSSVFGSEETDGAAEPEPETTMSPHAPDEQAFEERIAERLTAIEDKVDAIVPPPSETATPFDDPELAHKVVHACMQSDSISEDEELEILRTLLDG